MLGGMDCCDPNGLDKVFAGRLVRHERQVFWRKGLNGRQQRIVEQLGSFVAETSVLDLGCGIGAVGTTLLTKGAGSCTFVDISSAYLGAAREVAAKAGVGGKSSFYRDDFATSEHLYPQVDIVVLDRVVCCYPDATALLEKAARYSRRTLIFSYPRPFWFTPWFRALCAFGMRLIGQKYRFFLHDPQLLIKAASSAEHTHVVTHPVGLWQLVKVSKLYQK